MVRSSTAQTKSAAEQAAEEGLDIQEAYDQWLESIMQEAAR